MEEIFDVTDDNGFPVGRTVTRSEAHDKGIPHRTAHIWIVRKAGDSYEVAFVYVYEKPVDETKLVLQTEEVEEVKWFSIDDVLEGCKHRDGTFCVPMEGLETVMKHLGYDQA